MRTLKANNDLGTHQKKLTGIFNVSDTTIYAVPSGLAHNDAINGPFCWNATQLSALQQLTLLNFFYIGVDMSKFPSKFYFTENGRKWVHTCGYYGMWE